jgi:multiple antibiotic resistance protein
MFESFVTVLLVANVLPILPVILEFTADRAPAERRRLLLEAIAAGSVVAMLTAIGGGLLIDATRLTVDDLRVAGGVILLVFATFDLLFNREQRKRGLSDVMTDPATSLLVPLAVPLLVGPATLATVLVVAEDQGRLPALVAVVGNGLINAVILAGAQPIYDRIGAGFGRAFGKVMSLVLAAIAVSMIRAGVLGMIAATPAATP